jgi:hypothetical protein
MLAAWHHGLRRTSRRGREDALVADDVRAERTERLLVARLDALAHVASALAQADAERLVELAAVATMRAVALEMIRAEQAEAIWRAAHHRHPALPHVAVDLPQRLAA